MTLHPDPVGAARALVKGEAPREPSRARITPLRVYTSTLAYDGPGRFDCTRGSGGWLADPFAPSRALLKRFHPRWGAPPLTLERWGAFREAYLAEMRMSHRERPEAWAALFIASPLVLCCHEPAGQRCHRLILGAEILPKCGAIYVGELAPDERPA